MTVAVMMVFALSFGIRILRYNDISSFFGLAFGNGICSIDFKAVDRMSMLIVAGVMIGYICSAITEFIVTFADDSNIVNLHNWSLGSFSGITWEHVEVMTIVIFFCFIFVFLLSKPMSAISLVKHMQGIWSEYPVFSYGLVIIIQHFFCCVTAFAGPISFVGIAVPHLIKESDADSKTDVDDSPVFSEWNLLSVLRSVKPDNICTYGNSISTVTAVFGAPIVIYIMIRQKNGKV